MGSTAANFLREDFYVDDGLKSVQSVDEAVQLTKDAKEMCKRGGFRLHKFTSNSNEVISSVPLEDRVEEINNLDLDHQDVLPIERALGIQCCIENDRFNFLITLKDKPCKGNAVDSEFHLRPSGLCCGPCLAGREKDAARAMRGKYRLGRPCSS